LHPVMARFRRHSAQRSAVHQVAAGEPKGALSRGPGVPSSFTRRQPQPGSGSSGEWRETATLVRLQGCFRSEVGAFGGPPAGG
jgi:hypothetical protein